MRQNVFIIGATGRVGSTLVRQIYDAGDTDRRIHANPTKVIGLASKRAVLFSRRGINRNTALRFIRGRGGKPYSNLDAALRLADEIGEEVVFVDVTALKEEMLAFHTRIIAKTRHSIVTANKNPITYCDYKTFKLLTEEPRFYGYRCSVMAGADAVPFLRDMHDVRDLPHLIEGCFSGTLGYICTQLEEGKPFSKILRDARQRGYTEPDPRDDLSGFDVARKLVVLARSAGLDVGLEDVQVQPFIPRRFFRKESVGEFMQSAPGLDPYFRDKVRKAKKRGYSLRYIAALSMAGKKPRPRVALRTVPRSNGLGALRGTLNKICVQSRVHGKETPYCIEGPGAGLAVTAQNIRRDLLYLLESRVIAH